MPAFFLWTGGLHKPNIGVILGIVAGCAVILLLGGFLFILYKGRHKGYKREVFVDVAGCCLFTY